MDGTSIDLQLLANILIFTLMIVFLFFVLKRKWKLWISALILCAGITLTCLAVFHLPYRLGAIRQALCFFSCAALTLIVFCDKWTKTLFAFGMMYADMVLCEIVLSVIHPDLTQSENWLQAYALPEQIRICILYVLLYAVLLLLTSRLFTRKSSRFSSREWLLFAFFPASQAFMISLWALATTRASQQLNTIGQAVSVLICVAADIALFFAIRGMSQRAELKAQNELLSAQIDAQKQHYTALTAQYERVRVLRHDIANHVHTIQILLNQGSTKEAQDYAGEVFAQQTFQSSLGECANPIVDAFLFSRAEAARIQNIRFEFDVRLPQAPGVANVDLVTAFGNLMDNAEEACIRLPAEQRRIRLSAGIRGAFLAIRVENSAEEDRSGSRAERIAGLERGLGTHILKDLAAQYHGAFQTAWEAGLYIATLTLQTDGNQA